MRVTFSSYVLWRVFFSSLFILLSSCSDSDPENVKVPIYLSGEMLLGRVESARIQVYEVSEDYALRCNVESARDEQVLQRAGQIFIDRSCATEPDSLYLLKTSGGSDIDVDNDGVRDDLPTSVAGNVHALISGLQLAEGNWHVSALTELIYRQLRGPLGANFLAADISAALDERAKIYVSDINADGVVDYDDVLAWQPSPDFEQILLDRTLFAEYVAALRSNSDDLDEKIAALSGGVLSGIAAQGSGTRILEVAGNLAFYSDGDRGLSVYDISDPSQPQLRASYDTQYDITSLSSNGEHLVFTTSDNTSWLMLLEANRVSLIATYSNSSYAGISGDKMVYYSTSASQLRLVQLNAAAVPVQISSGNWNDLRSFSLEYGQLFNFDDTGSQEEDDAVLGFDLQAASPFSNWDFFQFASCCGRYYTLKGVTSSETHVFITTHGTEGDELQIFPKSAPQSEVVYKLPFDVSELRDLRFQARPANGDRLYLVFAEKIEILDVSDAESPQWINSKNFANASLESLRFRGDLPIASTANGIAFLDLDPGSNLLLVTQENISENANFEDYRIVESRLHNDTLHFAAEYDVQARQYLTLTMNDPDNLQLNSLGIYGEQMNFVLPFADTFYYQAWENDPFERYVYREGVQITDPSYLNNDMLPLCDNQNPDNHWVATGDYLLFSCANGLLSVDLSNRDVPDCVDVLGDYEDSFFCDSTVLGTDSTPLRNTEDMIREGDTVYVSTRDNGVFVVDAADPTQLSAVGEPLTLADTVSYGKLASNGELLTVATENSQGVSVLLILRLNNLDTALATIELPDSVQQIDHLQWVGNTLAVSISGTNKLHEIQFYLYQDGSEVNFHSSLVTSESLVELDTYNNLLLTVGQNSVRLYRVPITAVP